MVRLKCDKCNHIWKETKAQQESKSVYCPKCGRLHHTHSQYANPPKPIKYGGLREAPPPKKPSKQVKPPKKKVVFQKDLGGRTLDTKTVYTTEDEEKEK